MLTFRVWLLALLFLAISAYANTDDSEAATCAICLDDLAAPPPANEPTHISLHNCDHDDRFHAKCIKRWVLTNGRCPMCRKRASLPMTFDQWYAKYGEKIRVAAEHFHTADNARRQFERQVNSWDLESTLDYSRKIVATLMSQREYIRRYTSFLDRSEDFAIDTEAAFAKRYKRVLGLSKAAETWRSIMLIHELSDEYRELWHSARRIFQEASNSVTEASRRGKITAMFTFSMSRALKRVHKAIDMGLVGLMGTGTKLLRHTTQVLVTFISAEQEAGIAQ